MSHESVNTAHVLTMRQTFYARSGSETWCAFVVIANNSQPRGRAQSDDDTVRYWPPRLPLVLKAVWGRYGFFFDNQRSLDRAIIECVWVSATAP